MGLTALRTHLVWWDSPLNCHAEDSWQSNYSSRSRPWLHKIFLWKSQNMKLFICCSGIPRLGMEKSCSPKLAVFDFAWGDFNRLFWESSPLIFCWWSYIPSHSDYWYWSHSLGLETCANLRDSMAKKPMGLITLWGTAWTNICLSPLFPLQPSLRPLSNRTEGQSRESQTAFTMPL